MKKGLKAYLAIWIIFVILFNIICFIIPGASESSENAGSSFWTGYISIMIAFTAHLVYSCFTLAEKNKEKRIMNIPLNIISWTGLLIMVVTGSACMLIPNLPNWVSIIICYTVFAVSVIALVTTKTVSDKTNEYNDQLNRKTAFIRGLTATAGEISDMAKTPASRKLMAKISDALRYSDPVSSESTFEIEKSISAKLECLRKIIDNSDDNELTVKMEEILRLIEKRANICRMTKRHKG